MKTTEEKPIEAGIFVDGANLYFAQKKAGWKIDLVKLKEVMSQECNLICAKYFVAIPAKDDVTYHGTLSFLKHLKDKVEIVDKPLKYIKVSDQIMRKGDVDVELVIEVVRNLSDLDLVIVVSGDSDYLALRRYILDNDKKVIFVGFKHSLAWEIRKGKYLEFEKIRQFIEFGKKTPWSYPGRLLPDMNTKIRKIVK